MRSFVNALLLIPIFLKMVYNVFVVNEMRYKSYLWRALKQLQKKHGEKIPQHYKKRFDLYTKIATIFISWMETLHGEKLSKKQTQMALLFCGLTPLFDDLLDEEHYSAEELYLLSRKQPQRNTLMEKICVGLFEEMEKLRTDMGWTSRWQEAMTYQISSQKQFGRQLSNDEIKDITYGKGGYALLLYLDAMLPDGYSKAEGEAIFQMGALIQLTNDIFDIYKDSRAGLSTLATRCTDVQKLSDYYHSEIEKNMQQFRALDYSPFHIRKFLLQYQLLLSRGKVALGQLLALQKKAGGNFNPDRFSRRDLICDMELWRNIRKSLLLTIRAV